MAALVIGVLCVVVLLVRQAMANIRGEMPFNVTDPGALILLGAALISLGIWTRSYFFDKRGL